MATYSASSDAYFDDQARGSPRSFRQSNVQRPRPFDGYGTAQTTRFENATSGLRFENLREPFSTPMQSAPLNNTNFPYDVGTAQSWNSTAPTIPSFTNSVNGINGMQNLGAFGQSRSMRAPRGRLDYYDQPMPAGSQMSVFDNNQLGSMQTRRDASADGDDELIPTAIVIKNIPFAVKKEQLVNLMTELNLPLPYAFNYHFDNGVFRGLAFANFTSPDETAMVIHRLNHFELNGRKLRVEYKKMLPLYERERIEREKRERRGQLEEQHRPLGPGQLQSQLSLSSLNSHIPPRNTPSPNSQAAVIPEIDMNDAQNLEFYTKIINFKNDLSREVLIFPASLGPTERRTVHTLAHRAGLNHSSRGNGDQRQVHIFRQPVAPNTSPPNSSMSDAFQGNDGYRRNLNRSATTDFNEGRQYDGPPFNTLRGQSSVGFLDADTGVGRHDMATLRSAKSFHDLGRYRGGPSPVPSSSSATFPTALQTNGARLQALNDAEGLSTPNLTPTTSNNALGLANDENFLINGMNGMSMTNGQGSQTSPQRRGRFPFSTSTTWDEPQSYQATAPIGSNRTVSVNADNQSQERLPIRQSRGPAPERGAGFRRQNGRGSDELRNASSIIAE